MGYKKKSLYDQDFSGTKKKEKNLVYEDIKRSCFIPTCTSSSYHAYSQRQKKIWIFVPVLFHWSNHGYLAS